MNHVPEKEGEQCLRYFIQKAFDWNGYEKNLMKFGMFWTERGFRTSIR